MKDNILKISIITVCKNVEESIEKTIHSVINQTYADIEYIIIDGVSNDKTLEIIEKYKNKIAVFISEKDSGIYNAMNKGIEHSTGDILYFLNANDYLFDKNVIADIVEKFNKTKDASIVYGALATINEDNTLYTESKVEDIDKIFFMNGNCICHQCIFYKRILFSELGLYDESYKITADYDFNVKALVKNKFKYSTIDRTIVKFTLGGYSTSEKYRKTLLEERDKVIKRYFSTFEIKFNKILNKIFRSLLKNKYTRNLIIKLFGFGLKKI
jgi:glycosyltransferase involved in cell wall biosynthesis